MLRYENITLGSVTVYLLHYKNIEIASSKKLLLPPEIDRAQAIKHPLKREEFLATRILRTRLFGLKPIQYSTIGAPSITGVGHISISHSHNIIGIAHCNDFLIGLDLEPIQAKAMRVKHKFLSEQEKLAADTSSDEEMTKIWSGKEALYKLAGRKKIIFKENLLLQRIDETDWEGRLDFPECLKKVTLKIIKKDNLIISINASPIHEIRS